MIKSTVLLVTFSLYMKYDYCARDLKGYCFVQEDKTLITDETEHRAEFSEPTLFYVLKDLIA